MGLLQPVGQKRLTNISIVRFKKHGVRLEIACFKNKVLSWRNETETNINEVLQSETIFEDVTAGIQAVKQDLISIFNNDINPCLIKCKYILEHGDLQQGEDERALEIQTIQSDVSTSIISQTFDPELSTPLSAPALESLLSSCGVRYNVEQPIKVQTLKIMNMLCKKYPEQICRLPIVIHLHQAEIMNTKTDEIVFKDPTVAQYKNHYNKDKHSDIARTGSLDFKAQKGSKNKKKRNTNKKDDSDTEEEDFIPMTNAYAVREKAEKRKERAARLAIKRADAPKKIKEEPTVALLHATYKPDLKVTGKWEKAFELTEYVVMEESKTLAYILVPPPALSQISVFAAKEKLSYSTLPLDVCSLTEMELLQKYFYCYSHIKEESISKHEEKRLLAEQGMDTSMEYNCSTCRFGTNEMAKFREHMKSPWHVVNQRRACLCLESYTEEEFLKQEEILSKETIAQYMAEHRDRVSK